MFRFTRYAPFIIHLFLHQNDVELEKVMIRGEGAKVFYYAR